jgi:hypothetical protein
MRPHWRHFPWPRARRSGISGEQANIGDAGSRNSAAAAPLVQRGDRIRRSCRGLSDASCRACSRQVLAHRVAGCRAIHPVAIGGTADMRRIGRVGWSDVNDPPRHKPGRHPAVQHRPNLRSCVSQRARSFSRLKTARLEVRNGFEGQRWPHSS